MRLKTIDPQVYVTPKEVRAMGEALISYAKTLEQYVQSEDPKGYNYTMPLTDNISITLIWNPERIAGRIING